MRITLPGSYYEKPASGRGRTEGAGRAGRKWWRMRTCTARAAAGPGGRRPTIRRPDHRSQQPQRLARLRGPHGFPFVSPAGAQCRAAWRQRGPRGELHSEPGSRRGRATPTPSRMCPGIRSHSKGHSNRGGAGVRDPLPMPSRPLPSPHGLSPRPQLLDLGFVKSSAQTTLLPRRRTREQARRFRRRPRPVGVAALRLCPRGSGLGPPPLRSGAARGLPSPGGAGCPVVASDPAPPRAACPGSVGAKQVPWGPRRAPPQTPRRGAPLLCGLGVSGEACRQDPGRWRFLSYCMSGLLAGSARGACDS